jgi:hypothetical protein
MDDLFPVIRIEGKGGVGALTAGRTPTESEGSFSVESLDRCRLSGLNVQ